MKPDPNLHEPRARRDEDEPRKTWKARALEADDTAAFWKREYEEQKGLAQTFAEAVRLLKPHIQTAESNLAAIGNERDLALDQTNRMRRAFNAVMEILHDDPRAFPGGLVAVTSPEFMERLAGLGGEPGDQEARDTAVLIHLGMDQPWLSLSSGAGHEKSARSARRVGGARVSAIAFANFVIGIVFGGAAMWYLIKALSSTLCLP